jgi:hypothetical protein
MKVMKQLSWTGRDGATGGESSQSPAKQQTAQRKAARKKKGHKEKEKKV